MLIDRLSIDVDSVTSPLSPISEASVELLPRGVTFADYGSCSRPLQQARNAGQEMDPGAPRWGDEEAGLRPLGFRGSDEPDRQEGRR